jgi:cytidylate kinase
MFRALASEKKMTLGEFEELCRLDDQYDISVDKKVEDYGKSHNDFIFESRLAWYFIPDSFKIYFDCEFEERISRVAYREKKPLEQVREETLDRESAIAERYEKYYGIKDVTDKTNFDLVIDTKVHNLEEVVSLILKTLEDKLGIVPRQK